MNYIYWNLQKTNASDKLEVGSKEFEMYRQHFKKDYETRELMTEQETVEHYEKFAYKNPLFSRIYSLTLAFENEGVLRVKYFTGSEKDLITTFLNTLKDSHFSDYGVVHYDAEVILPYLGTRVAMNKIKTTLPNQLLYQNMRSWNFTGTCVRSYFQGGGVYKNNLKEIAWIYGIEADFIDFQDEFTAYQTGDFVGLEQSAVNQITTLVNVHRSLLGDSLLEEVVGGREFVQEVKEVEETDVLKDLYDANKLTPVIKNKIKKMCAGKRLTKKDKENLYTILRGIYVRCNFEHNDQDNKKVIADKELEITTLISEL